MQVAKKISNKLFSDLAIGAAVTLAGVIRTYSREEGTYGPYIKFDGEFAMRHGGEVVMASTMFLPEIAANLLANAADRAASEAGDSFSGLEFGIELVKNSDPDERNARKYQWGVRPLVEPTSSTSRALALLGEPVEPPQASLDLEGKADSDADTSKSSKSGKAVKP